MTIVPTVDARWACHAVAWLNDAGVRDSPLLRRAKLRRIHLAEPDARIPFHKHAALLEHAAEALGDPLFGLHLGGTIQPGKAGLLGCVMLGAPTLEEALLSLERYLRVLDEGFTLEMEIKRKRTALVAAIDDHRVAARRQATEFGISLLASLCRTLTDTLVEPVRVEFEHPVAAKPGAYEKVLGARARFEQPRNALVIDTDDLDLPVRKSNAPLLHLIERHGRAVLGKPPAVKDLPYRVRELIVRFLTSSDVGIDTVAQELGMSVRTLERRLQPHGFVYKRVIDDIRRALALRYLKDRQLTLPQIAFLLGYSEFASFIHACQRWTGTTPTRYRAERGYAGAPAAQRGRPSEWTFAPGD